MSDAMEERAGLVLAIDIGGTKVAAGVLEGARPLALRSIPSRPELAPAAMVEVIVDELAGMLAALERGAGEASGLGVGFPGDFDPLSGELKTAPNLPLWVGACPRSLFTAALERRWGRELPVVADNDACVATLAEARCGAGAGAEQLLYLTVSTGVGGARYDRGATRNLEPGLYTFPDPERPDVCLEKLASGPSIADRARREIRAFLGEHGAAALPRLTSVLDGAGGLDAEELDRRLAALTARDLGGAAIAGDELSRELFARSARILAAGIAQLLEPGDERVVLGGSVAVKTPGYVDEVRRELARRRALADAPPTLRAFDPAQIVAAALGDERGVLGAAALVG